MFSFRTALALVIQGPHLKNNELINQPTNNQKQSSFYFIVPLQKVYLIFL